MLSTVYCPRVDGILCRRSRTRLSFILGACPLSFGLLFRVPAAPSDEMPTLTRTGAIVLYGRTDVNRQPVHSKFQVVPFQVELGASRWKRGNIDTHDAGGFLLSLQARYANSHRSTPKWIVADADIASPHAQVQADAGRDREVERAVCGIILQFGDPYGITPLGHHGTRGVPYGLISDMLRNLARTPDP
jgi:hypothetical protein